MFSKHRFIKKSAFIELILILSGKIRPFRFESEFGLFDTDSDLESGGPISKPIPLSNKLKQKPSRYKSTICYLFSISIKINRRYISFLLTIIQLKCKEAEREKKIKSNSISIAISFIHLLHKQRQVSVPEIY